MHSHHPILLRRSGRIKHWRFGWRKRHRRGCFLQLRRSLANIWRGLQLLGFLLPNLGRLSTSLFGCCLLYFLLLLQGRQPQLLHLQPDPLFLCRLFSLLFLLLAFYGQFSLFLHKLLLSGHIVTRIRNSRFRCKAPILVWWSGSRARLL